MSGQRIVPPHYKWVALGITTIGVLMVAIDTTVVALALPTVMADLHSNLVSMTWVLMIYIFVSTILLLGLGRVADIYGRVRLYNLGFVIFTAGSAFCGLATSDGQLVAARLVQGVGGAMLIVNSLAILTEAFPPGQRGTAMGFNSMTFGVGSIVGPVVGGLILAATSWRWIFLVNVPIGVVGTALAYLCLRDLSTPRDQERLDVVGTVAFSVGLLALLLALTRGIELGWASAPILALFGFSLAAFAFFAYWELHSPSPALDLSLFRNRLYDFSVLAAAFQSLAIFSVQFLVVFYLQAVRGYTPFSAALHLLPLPIVNAIVGPLSGRLSDRVGARLPASSGLLIQAAALYWLSTTTIASTYFHVAVGLGLMGLGGGLFWSPNTSAAMGAAPSSRLGVAAATLATLRNSGMVTSFAVALAVAAGSLPQDLVQQLFIGTSVHLGSPLMLAFVTGMEAAFRFSMAVCLIAAALSFVRGSEERRS